MSVKPEPPSEALERLLELLDGEVPDEDGDVFVRLLQALVRRAGAEGERLFAQRLTGEANPRRLRKMVEASVGALGPRAVAALRDAALRRPGDAARVEPIAATLARLGTPDAHEALVRVERGSVGACLPAVNEARVQIEGRHPTRYRLLPLLRTLGDDAREGRRLAAELLAAEDDELVPVLLDAWDGLGVFARRVVLAMLERRGDSFSGHVIQGEIETCGFGRLAVPMCRALRGILRRHPESVRGYEDLWQRLWTEHPGDPEVAETAALALAADPTPEKATLYREFLASPLAAVRLVGLRALSAAPSPEARADLLRALEAGGEEEMAGALEALTALGDEEVLEQWARTSDPVRRRGVARVCLRTLRQDLWVDLAADRDVSVAATALDSWNDAPERARLDSRRVVGLLNRSKSEAVVQRTCRILASIGDLEAVAPLAKCLQRRGGGRVQVIRTLKALRIRQVYAWKDLTSATKTAVLRALEDTEDPDVLSFLSTLALDLPANVLGRVRHAARGPEGEAVKAAETDARAQEVAEVIYAHLLEKIEARERREFATSEVNRLLEARGERPNQMASAVRRIAELWGMPQLGLGEDVAHRVEQFMAQVSADRTVAHGTRCDAIRALGGRGTADAVAGLLRLRRHPVEDIALAAQAAVDAFARAHPGANLAQVRSRQEAGGQVVLVAEDEPGVRSLYQAFLHQNGFTAVGASNGEEALRVLEGRSVGVLVLDLDMPRLDGFGVLTALQKRPARPPVIVVTGHSDQGSVVRAHALGAAEILRKPVDLLDLLERVRRAAPWAADRPLPAPEAVGAALRGRAHLAGADAVVLPVKGGAPALRDPAGLPRTKP